MIPYRKMDLFHDMLEIDAAVTFMKIHESESYGCLSEIQ